ncbi:MAG: DUF3866 family protein [Mycobacteriales bacterium]
MIRWRNGVVTEIGKSWDGAQELEVRLSGSDEGTQVRALAYPRLVGAPRPGDRVVLNTTALAMGLGTGGYAFVVAIPDRLPPDPEGPGHMVKARYTPLQATMMGVDEQESPHHSAIAAAQDIAGMPVVVADLHSALPAILLGVLADAPDARVAYLMTDGAALPIWFSRAVSQLHGRLCGTVTVGQSFGGDAEAVTVHAGLLAAKHVLGADVTIVAQGPGNLGTGTPWGFSGIAAGEAINAVAALAGRPIGALRISDADPRGRHVGISHHSVTAFGRIALAAADIVVPKELPEKLATAVDGDLAPLRGRHTIVKIDTAGLDAALRSSAVKLSTMGRWLDADYSYFLAAAAAGRHAAAVLAATGGLTGSI